MDFLATLSFWGALPPCQL